MRLDKYLADMGLGTRNEIRKLARSQRVTVNGVVIRDAGFRIDDPAQSLVCVDGQPVRYETLVYYMLNKPAGLLSASQDRRAVTVVDVIREQEETAGRLVRTDLFPAGRLDKDTEGLILITNDGPLAHRLLTPGQHVDKVYYAVVTGEMTAEDVVRFANGIRYDETLKAAPAGLRILSVDRKRNLSEIEVTIHEGKFHQIRKMVAALGGGKEVQYLRRTALGPLQLDAALAPGEYRRLTQEEIRALRQER